jgi:peroxiredoxin
MNYSSQFWNSIFAFMKKLFFFVAISIYGSVLIAQDKPEGLFINSKAPDFKAKDQSGIEVNLKELRKKGSVVIVFYRGNWCPYCNRYLKKLEDSLQFIKEKGAQLVAITPEKQEGIEKTIEKTKASFAILHDEDLKIMKAYDVEYQMDERTVGRYKNADIDLAVINDKKNANYLPVPAVYIVNKEGSIVYRFFDVDYKKRVSVSEILENLK